MSEVSGTGKPPVFGRWRGWYLLLAIFTLVQFLIYYALTAWLNHPF